MGMKRASGLDPPINRSPSLDLIRAWLISHQSQPQKLFSGGLTCFTRIESSCRHLDVPYKLTRAHRSHLQSCGTVSKMFQYESHTT